jgi:hypothetical protein
MWAECAGFIILVQRIDFRFLERTITRTLAFDATGSSLNIRDKVAFIMGVFSLADRRESGRVGRDEAVDHGEGSVWGRWVWEFAGGSWRVGGWE